VVAVWVGRGCAKRAVVLSGLWEYVEEWKRKHKQLYVEVELSEVCGGGLCSGVLFNNCSRVVLQSMCVRKSLQSLVSRF
jgi:hypothetical protein